MTEQLPSQELIDFIGLHQSAEEINIFPGLNQLNQLNHQADTKKDKKKMKKKEINKWKKWRISQLDPVLKLPGIHLCLVGLILGFPTVP